MKWAAYNCFVVSKVHIVGAPKTRRIMTSYTTSRVIRTTRKHKTRPIHSLIISMEERNFFPSFMVSFPEIPFTDVSKNGLSPLFRGSAGDGATKCTLKIANPGGQKALPFRVPFPYLDAAFFSFSISGSTTFLPKVKGCDRPRHWLIFSRYWYWE